jgi:hypothetical protein
MNVRLSTMTSSELETAMAHLVGAGLFFRSIGDYMFAAKCKSRASECAQHLIVRENDRRVLAVRQLSLCPPGAYEQPA